MGNPQLDAHWRTDSSHLFPQGLDQAWQRTGGNGTIWSMPPGCLNQWQERHEKNNFFHWVWEQVCCPPSCQQTLWQPGQLDLSAEVHPLVPVLQ